MTLYTIRSTQFGHVVLTICLQVGIVGALGFYKSEAVAQQSVTEQYQTPLEEVSEAIYRNHRRFLTWQLMQQRESAGEA